MLFILLFFVLHWYVSLFMHSFLHHRYASHGAFSMNKFWERFFYVVAYITQGSSYVSPRVYAIMHRMHHAYTDTDKDPHSPKNDANMFVMMWKTRVMAKKIYRTDYPIAPKFLKNLPDWKFLDKVGQSTWSRLVWIAIYVAVYVIFSPSAWFFLLLPIHILMVPIQGVVVNWFAHKYGHINFKLKNTSTNLFKLDWLMLGEAYHNNHHKFPSSTNFGSKWYELDPTYMVIRVFKKLGIVKLREVAVVQERTNAV